MGKNRVSTAEEFNKKYKHYLEERFYGMAINDPDAIAYLDEEFEREIAINPEFTYSQIKMKYGMVRVYATSPKTIMWENEINKILSTK